MQEYVLPGEIVGLYRKNDMEYYVFGEANAPDAFETALLTRLELEQYNLAIAALESWNNEIRYRAMYHRQSATVEGINITALCPAVENKAEKLTCGEDDCPACQHEPYRYDQTRKA